MWMSGVETVEEIPWLTTVNCARPTALCETARKDLILLPFGAKKEKCEGFYYFFSF